MRSEGKGEDKIWYGLPQDHLAAVIREDGKGEKPRGRAIRKLQKSRRDIMVSWAKIS